MKPVLKRQTTYSLLLMRDDCGVRSFRVRAFWLKFLLYFVLLFCAASGTAGYLAHSYWKKYNDIQEERRDLERQLAETRRRLEPLAYLEKIQEISQSRFAVGGTGGTGGATGPPNGAGPVNGVHSIAATGVSAPGSGNASTVIGPHITVANQTMLPVSVAASNATMTASTPSPADTGKNQTQKTQAEEEDPHPAKISNVSLRAAGNTRIRVAFDLSNQDPQQTLNGRVTLSVITHAGATAEITQVERADLSFLIARYKKIITTFTLPANIQASDVAFVQITLTGDNVPRYSERFPMQ